MEKLQNGGRFLYVLSTRIIFGMSAQAESVPMIVVNH